MAPKKQPKKKSSSSQPTPSSPLSQVPSTSTDQRPPPTNSSTQSPARQRSKIIETDSELEIFYEDQRYRTLFEAISQTSKVQVTTTHFHTFILSDYSHLFLTFKLILESVYQRHFFRNTLSSSQSNRFRKIEKVNQRSRMDGRKDTIR
jgi:hypothetical protein